MKKKQIIIILISLVIGVGLISASYLLTKNESEPTQSASKVVLTSKELSEADGKNGNNCYVAIDNTVYEIKQGNKWKDGQHEPSNGLAYCGENMTDVINQSPHGKSILLLLQEVGTIQN
jgi:predicted heme/steroid binding protein